MKLCARGLKMGISKKISMKCDQVINILKQGCLDTRAACADVGCGGGSGEVSG